MLLGALLVLCFLASDSLAPRQYNAVVERFALIPENVFYAPWTLVSYALLHDGWEHLIFNLAWLVIFGSTIAKHLGSVRFFLFFAFCAVLAGAGYTILHIGSNFPAIGASGAVFGMLGALTRFLFPPQGGILATQPQSIEKTLRNRQTFAIIAVIIGIDLLFAAVSGILGTGMIAWEAHIGGFIAGFVCFGLFAPPTRSISGGPGNLNYGEWR
ncbi:MAG: rhomboid family intramembrane serine protease [Hyphomicrobiales bacterium]|nr:rhomboid family intramembrane serine protease [Hyphomicrobiales bacterium]MCY4032568.1 rhomboid family intramembrane serine protease [Hyphomicrobiales bacterium]MCY4037971.1 rhomboid family intramembrane serine protease [Hyphomicrobiales bacterium]